MSDYERSDYLRSLAARSLGAADAPLLQPRPVARFESETGAAEPPLIENPEASEPGGQVAPSTPPPPPMAAHKDAAPTPLPPPAQPIAAPGDPSTTPAARTAREGLFDEAPRADARMSPRLPEPRGHTPLPEDAQQAAQRATLPTLRQHIAAEATPPVPTEAVSAPLVAPPQRDHEPVVRPAVLSPRSPAPPEAPDGPAPPSGSDRQPTALRPGSAAPVSASASAPSPAIRQEGTEPPAPAVQITIGRIEVRAATPPAPPPRAAPPAPRLSLDDYLKGKR